jgi:hypothetical protein
VFKQKFAMSLPYSETDLPLDGGAEDLNLAVSREITRRLSEPWFKRMGWNWSGFSAEQQVAVRDARAFLFAVREEVFSLADYEARRLKLEDWTFSLSQAFMGQAHSDAAAAIAASAEAYRIPRAFFYDQLAAMEANLFRERLVTSNDLLRLAYRQSGVFLQSVAQVADLYAPAHRDYFLCLGMGAGLLDVLLDWEHWERSHWLPVPLEWVSEVRGGVAAVYQPDWRQPLRVTPRSRQQLWPSLRRRVATLGIETLSQASVPLGVQQSSIGPTLEGWLRHCLDRLYELFDQP